MCDDEAMFLHSILTLVKINGMKFLNIKTCVQ